MMRLGPILAGLLFGVLLAAPASANTIATFAVSGYFFGGGTVSGNFSLDLTTQKVASASITTTSGAVVVGASYPGFALDSYNVETSGSTTFTRLVFNNSATALPPLSGQQLTLFMRPLDATYLASLPTFQILGN